LTFFLVSYVWESNSYDWDDYPIYGCGISYFHIPASSLNNPRKEYLKTHLSVGGWGLITATNSTDLVLAIHWIKEAKFKHWTIFTSAPFPTTKFHHGAAFFICFGNPEDIKKFKAEIKTDDGMHSNFFFILTYPSEINFIPYVQPFRNEIITRKSIKRDHPFGLQIVSQMLVYCENQDDIPTFFDFFPSEPVFLLWCIQNNILYHAFNAPTSKS